MLAVLTSFCGSTLTWGLWHLVSFIVWSIVSLYSRSVLGPSKDHPPDPSAAPLQILPEPPLPDCLRFESRFESGNLAKVIRITEAYYEIYLRPDYYTSKHCQWFYFQVRFFVSDDYIAPLCTFFQLFCFRIAPFCTTTNSLEICMKYAWFTALVKSTQSYPIVVRFSTLFRCKIWGLI